jgi:hypothetical protein
MILFFSGLGILVPVAAFVGFIIPIVGNMWAKSHGINVPNSVVNSLMGLMPFFALLTVDQILTKMGPTRKAFDVKTGTEVQVAVTHTFMFLKVK